MVSGMLIYAAYTDSNIYAGFKPTFHSKSGGDAKNTDTRTLA